MNRQQRDKAEHRMDIDVLTDMVDGSSMQYLLECLSEIASTKASAAKDPTAKKQWDFAAACLISMSQRPHIRIVSPHPTAPVSEWVEVKCPHCETEDRFLPIDDVTEFRCGHCDRWFPIAAPAR